jgi:hypothetical protein
MIKIKQTEDTELLEEILKQLEANDHFCPCHLTTTSDDKCMCKKFREVVNSNQPGTYECDCGRYTVTITKD